jgi:hypothetical protein
MANFEEFKQQTAETAEMIAGKSIQFAKLAAEKTKRIAKIAKLKAEIIAEKDSRRKMLMKLGKLYYENYGCDPQEPLKETVGKIDELNARIKEMQVRIDEIKAESAREAGEADVEIEITVIKEAEEVEPEETISMTDEEPVPEEEEEKPTE